jgi:hypothetical protein
VKTLTRDNIRVITPALFQDLRPIWMLTHTAERFNVPLWPYGMGGTYAGWIDVKVHRILAECDKLMAAGYSHLLYMDGRDTMLMSTIEEVLEKYERIYGAPPMLMSAQPEIFMSYEKYYNLDLYPTAEELGHPYCYPGSPLYMGEVSYIRDCLLWMLGQNWDGQMPDDDPAWWRRFDNERQDELQSGRIKFDHGCEIFQNSGWRIGSDLAIKEGRVFNTLTHSWPVVIHWDGGYSHHLSGKWQALQQYWKALGYGDVLPPWDRKEETQ